MLEVREIRILIVEDDPTIAKYLQLNLAKLGYQVCGLATTGKEAIERGLESQANLVLMNLHLQGEIGAVEAANHIYQELGLPVVFLTAFSDQETIEEATKAKPFGYIIKPFDQQNLSANIQIALTRYDAEKEIKRNMHCKEELRQQAEELGEMRSRYLAIASHEFRTPLSSILFASTLLEGCSQTWSEKKKQDYLQLISRSAKDMTQLIDDMLTVEKTGKSQFSFKPALLDLVSFCQKLVEQMQPLAPTLSPIDFKYEGDFLGFYLDVKLLRHIFTNLLSNAIKYSPQGTPVLFTLTREDNQAIFIVRDRGIGIPSTDLEKLFSVFHRGKNVKGIKGTGLGLSIVKNCVELHGGHIEVESVQDQGTTFTVVLPLIDHSQITNNPQSVEQNTPKQLF